MLSMRKAFLALAIVGMLSTSACERIAGDDARPKTSRDFPKAERLVMAGNALASASESERDDVNEAETVMDLARVSAGMSVADVGAGSGYYTVRLAQRVGRAGRVLAEDIDPDMMQKLGLRVEREHLENVSIKLGTVDDPRLPENSFDRIFLVHVYREIDEPYAFLWRLRPALRKGGKVIVVGVDRDADARGIAPSLLFCEFAASGFRLNQFIRKPELQGYFAQFEAIGERPEPGAIVPCRMSGKTDMK